MNTTTKTDRDAEIDAAVDGEERCELLIDLDCRCPNRATRIVREPYTPAAFKMQVCDECAKSQIDSGYSDGGLIESPFKEAADKACEQLADTWEESDRRNGIEPHDYSMLRRTYQQQQGGK